MALEDFNNFYTPEYKKEEEKPKLDEKLYQELYKSDLFLTQPGEIQSGYNDETKRNSKKARQELIRQIKADIKKKKG